AHAPSTGSPPRPTLLCCLKFKPTAGRRTRRPAAPTLTCKISTVSGRKPAGPSPPASETAGSRRFYGRRSPHIRRRSRLPSGITSMNFPLRASVLPALVLAVSSLLSSQATSAKADERGIPEIINAVTPALMEDASVPGVSVALVQDHEIAWLGQYGVTSADDPKPVTAKTLFEAASMSKPAFALVVLRLVEEGVLDLDTPLADYLGRPYIEDEPLHKRITARMVLSHRTGFPNWRPGGWRKGGPLPVKFVPGTGYGYSGEGFLFLQRVIEHLTGQTTEDLTREHLL